MTTDTGTAAEAAPGEQADRQTDGGARGDSDAGSATVDFGFNRYHGAGRMRPADSPEFRRHYGRLRTYYRHRPDKYRDLQRWLNQARFGINYDRYLERTAQYAIVASVVGILVGIALTYGLLRAGVVAGLQNPLSYQGDLTRYIGQNRALFAGAALAVVAGVTAAVTVWYARYFHPRSVASSRQQNIDMTLPHAITFMYALSYGGMDLLEVVERLGDAQDTYGEVANEFQMVVREVDLFGNDLNTALQNTRNLTPSDNLEQFLDDLLSVMDSGGDVTVFLETETDTYLEEARDQQTGFIETLSLLSEVFVVMFVAAPLFAIVLLIVMSLLGADTLDQVTLLVYVLLPLAMAGFLVLIDVLSTPFDQPDVRLEPDAHATATGDARLVASVASDVVAQTAEAVVASVRELVGTERPVALNDADYLAAQRTAYLRRRRRRHLRTVARRPLAAFHLTPLASLVVTVPLAVGVLAAVTLGGVVEPTRAATLAEPVRATVWLVVVPFLVVAVPLTVFVERQNYRVRHISAAFPETLNALSSANKMGVGTSDALGLVSKWTSGPIGAELRTVRNDIEWNHDPSRALRAFADRLQVPQLSRSMKLVAEGMRSSSDLARVLSIAADDTRNRFKIEQQRRRELGSYVAVVIIGYLVYLLVVALLTKAYLEPIADVPAVPTPGTTSTPFSVSSLPVSAYELLFFHSAVIQGIGSGLLAGKLVENRALSGLKYGIALVIVAVATFTLI